MGRNFNGFQASPARPYERVALKWSNRSFDLLVNIDTHNLEKSIAGLQIKEMNIDQYEIYIRIQFVPDREHHPFRL
jgi:hypothetical protein